MKIALKMWLDNLIGAVIVSLIIAQIVGFGGGLVEGFFHRHSDNCGLKYYGNYIVPTFSATCKFIRFLRTPVGQ